MGKNPPASLRAGMVAIGTNRDALTLSPKRLGQNSSPPFPCYGILEMWVWGHQETEKRRPRGLGNLPCQKSGLPLISASSEKDAPEYLLPNIKPPSILQAPLHHQGSVFTLCQAALCSPKPETTEADTEGRMGCTELDLRPFWSQGGQLGTKGIPPTIPSSHQH